MMVMQKVTRAEEIIDFIRSCTDKKYGLVISEGFNAITGEFYTQSCHFDDIGDYLHFIVWYGLLTNNKEYIDFGEKQVRLWNTYFRTPEGFYIEYRPEKSNAKPSSFSPINMYHNWDGLVGLTPMFLLTKNKLYLETGSSLLNAIIQYGFTPKNTLYRYFLPRYRIPLLKPCKTEIEGLILEEFNIYYSLTRKEKYLLAAEKLFEAWNNFCPEGMFFDRLIPFLWKPMSYNASVMKTNTCMSYGLLRLYLNTKNKKVLDRLISLLDAVKNIRVNGGFQTTVNTKTGKIVNNKISLNHNHQMIDVFINCYRSLNDKEFLRVAEECVDYWLQQKSEIDLIPEHQKGRDVKIDSIADFVVILLKMYDLTKQNKYYKESEKILDAINKYFYHGKTCVQVVHADSGRVITPTNNINYVGGALRAHILKSFIEDGGKIYGNKPVEFIVRDR